MGKASSNKKIARAARAGGGRVSSGQPRSLLFPSVLTLVVVLGLALVVYAREDRQNDDAGGVPRLGDHIHEALAFNVCGEFLPNLPQFESNIGIHTHGDGVMHIHPFSQLGVGSNATLGRYLKDAKEAGLEVSLSNSKLDYLGDVTEEGETECEGVDDPILRLAYWDNVQDEASAPTVISGDFTDYETTTDGGGITVFYGDKDADIPKPPNAEKLTELGAVDQNPNASSTTVPADGSSTTVPADASSTTVPADAASTTSTPAP
jgi:hypothetical protein